MKVLFFGDVYGKAGRQTVQAAIPELKARFQPDFILANGGKPCRRQRHNRKDTDSTF